MSKISNEQLEQLFDDGKDITQFMEVDTVQRPNQTQTAKRISMDVPAELVRGLDRAAKRMGVNRQAVIKVWLTERLDQETERERARTVI